MGRSQKIEIVSLFDEPIWLSRMPIIWQGLARIQSVGARHKSKRCERYPIGRLPISMEPGWLCPLVSSFSSSTPARLGLPWLDAPGAPCFQASTGLRSVQQQPGSLAGPNWHSCTIAVIVAASPRVQHTRNVPNYLPGSNGRGDVPTYAVSSQASWRCTCGCRRLLQTRKSSL